MALVYFISDGEYIKIGQTTSLETRLANLQCANARKLIVLHTIESDDSGYISMLESKLHGHFKAFRASGEWFKLEWVAAYAEVLSVEIDLKSQMEKHNAEWAVSRQWWVKRMLQSRFDALVDQDIKENYPPLKKFSPTSFSNTPYVPKFVVANFKTFGQQEKEQKFTFNPTNEDGTPRKSRFG